MKAAAEGWISIGISPTVGMKDADMIIGWVDSEGHVYVFDAFSTGEYGPHPPDTELGGTDDIIEFGGTQIGEWTTIEVTRNVNSTDLYDRNFRSEDRLDVIWGYSDTEEFDDYHSARGAGQIVISEELPAGEEDEDEDVEGPPVILIVVIVVMIVIILAAVAVYTQSKRRKEAREMEAELTSTGQENARMPR
jgi:hypothetical protein